MRLPQRVNTLRNDRIIKCNDITTLHIANAKLYSAMTWIDNIQLFYKNEKTSKLIFLVVRKTKIATVSTVAIV